jgi:iron complex outermembrane receptor protein
LGSFGAKLPACGAAIALLFPCAAIAQTASDLSALSLEELANVQVTSVSKRSEPLSRAASAIYVIDREEILRSGADTLPQMLRLAPNLFIAQTSASRHIITARGFNGSEAAQNFSNKLLVLIDGRSVYSPLFSGVYWDMQDVAPEDVERIEVVSGPGATLWGANAVNGVINITTRPATDTTGVLVSGVAGDQERSLSARVGGLLGERAAVRIYIRGYEGDDANLAGGGPAEDGWWRTQGGFRMDWSLSDTQSLTVQGDAFEGSDDSLGGGEEAFRGRNLLARWVRRGADGSVIRVQGYYDRSERATLGAGKSAVDTFDLDLQHSLALGDRHELVWGGGLRSSDYRIQGTPDFFFVPARGTLNLANVYVQDTWTVTPDLRLTAGLKVEDDPFAKAEFLPNIRLAWTPDPRTLVWAAASRAVRSPTPFDRDVRERLGGTLFLTGDAEFRHETLTAYEAGVRMQPLPNANFSVSVFHNVYEDLRSIEFSPVGFLPLSWGNRMKGRTDGLEAWGEYRPFLWWRLSAGYSYLDKHLRFEPESAAILGTPSAGNDPKHQAFLRSAFDIGSSVTLDANLRYVSALPDPHVPAYVELDSRLRWRITDNQALFVGGRNLLHDDHVEYAPGAAIPRSVFVGLRWRF